MQTTRIKANPSPAAFTRISWSIGLLTSTLLFALVFLFFDLSYANNDDTYILRVMMGMGSPELPTFNMCLHFILLYPLRWLATALPDVAWFSWMQLFFLWLSGAVTVKALLQCFRHAGRPLWQGLAACAVLLMLFLFPYFCEVTFTVTAAVLGAAAVLQVLSIDEGRYTAGQTIRALLLAVLLAVLAYGLRQITAVPILAFCLLAGLYKALQAKAEDRPRALRPYLCAALAALVVFGALAGLRELEIDQKDVRGYLEWQSLNGDVLDYHSLNELPPEKLEEAGWTENEVAMVADWYFMDEAISVDAFRTLSAAIAAQEDQSLSAKLSRGWEAFSAFPAKEPFAAASMVALCLTMLLCSVCLLMREGRRALTAVALFLGMLGAFAFLGYLSVKGRLPLRATLMPVLPFAAFVFGLLPVCLPERGSRGKSVAALLLSLGVAVFAGFQAAPYLQKQLKPPVDPYAEAVSAYQDLDEFAVDNEELLLICDPTLVSDLRMFPSTAYGLPKNLLFWGGWGARSPEYNAQLRSYGFDPEHWQVTDFLNENVRLMRGVIDPPPSRLLNHLNDSVPADCMMDSEYGYVYSFSFYQNE